MNNPFLFSAFVFLIAACIVVPLTSRFKLGSVLGYLAAGILIGPFGIGLIRNAQEIMHFAEFGVVMMLFLIGLELEPAKLWRLRHSIVLLGGLQVLLSTLAFTLLGIALGFEWDASLACGMALSLSSTALVLQILQEKGLLKTDLGQFSFSVLLFQDIAVIPILIILPLLADEETQPTHMAQATHFGWEHTVLIAGVIALVFLVGRYFSHYFFRFIAKSNLREIFTATSLALVVGITLLMEYLGVSPALGAFVAGVVLANSEYKHTLETDIEPFKGLLLGLFFISVGMSMDFKLFAQQPEKLLIAVILLMAIKAGLLFILGRIFKLKKTYNLGFALALCQGGEFAFVLFQYAEGLNVIEPEQYAFLNLAVAFSMAMTPILMMAYNFYLNKLRTKPKAKPIYDQIEEQDQQVIIAGYGRFGQIIGRFLDAQGIKLTVLEKDPDQIELLRRFGSKVYFGDATRLDLLKSAGAEKAKLLIVTLSDPKQVVKLVRLAKQHFPHLKVFARARNRRHVYELHKAGADYYRREFFDSSLTMAQEAMRVFGYRAFDMRHKAKKFMRHDEETLQASFEFFEHDREMARFVRHATQELERILQSDIEDKKMHENRNEGWGE